MALRGNLDAVKRLLDEGIDAEAKDSFNGRVDDMPPPSCPAPSPPPRARPAYSGFFGVWVGCVAWGACGVVAAACTPPPPSACVCVYLCVYVCFSVCVCVWCVCVWCFFVCVCVCGCVFVCVGVCVCVWCVCAVWMLAIVLKWLVA